MTKYNFDEHLNLSESAGLKINVSKTKLMKIGKSNENLQKLKKWTSFSILAAR